MGVSRNGGIPQESWKIIGKMIITYWNLRYPIFTQTQMGGMNPPENVDLLVGLTQ